MPIPNFTVKLLAAFGLSLALSPAPAHAGSVPDCITLLNRTSSAASNVRAWRGTNPIVVSAMGDNGPAIDRLTREFKKLRSTYKATMTCINSEEARRSKQYAKARPRFASGMPKHKKAIDDAEVVVASFSAAIDASNRLRDLVRRLNAADGSRYEAELSYARKSMDAEFRHMAKNEFLTSKWRKDVENIVNGRMRTLRAEKEELDRKAAQKELADSAVVKRLSGFSRDDAMDPRKVAKAFEQSSAKDVAVLPFSYDLQIYAPVDRHHPIKSTLAMSYPNDREPATPAFVYTNQRVVFVRYKKDELPKTKQAIPGLVWDVRGKEVIFVSTSGGRYISRINHVSRASSFEGSMASTAINSVIVHDDVVELSRRGILNARRGRDMAVAKSAYASCAAKIWKAKERAFTKLETANILPSARRARRMELDGKVRTSVNRKCKSAHTKYSAAWNKAMQEYRELRAQTLEVAKTKLRR